MLQIAFVMYLKKKQCLPKISVTTVYTNKRIRMYPYINKYIKQTFVFNARTFRQFVCESAANKLLFMIWYGSVLDYRFGINNLLWLLACGDIIIFFRIHHTHTYSTHTKRTHHKKKHHDTSSQCAQCMCVEKGHLCTVKNKYTLKYDVRCPIYTHTHGHGPRTSSEKK